MTGYFSIPEDPAQPEYARGQTVEYMFKGRAVEGVIQRIEAVWPSYGDPKLPPEIRYEISHPALLYTRAIVKAGEILTPAYGGRAG